MMLDRILIIRAILPTSLQALDETLPTPLPPSSPSLANDVGNQQDDDSSSSSDDE